MTVSRIFIFLDPGSRIQDPGSRIQDPGSWIQDPGSYDKNQIKGIQKYKNVSFIGVRSKVVRIQGSRHVENMCMDLPGQVLGPMGPQGA